VPNETLPATPISRADPGALTLQLVRRLTESIQSGELRPGDLLPTEGELVRRHGVSRTVVREAMSRLNAQGLVETQHGRGSFVLTGPSAVSFSVDASQARSAQELAELLEFRIGFETEAAALASARADSGKVAAVRDALSRFLAATDRPGDSVRADFEFHRSIAVASGNRYLLQILDSLGSAAIATPPARLVVSTDERPSPHQAIVGMEHRTIYEAIARRDPADARAAMRVHLANSKQRLSPRPGAAQP
jgi:GntR family transcriptional regulator, transcriptional repressor for pyruvate dehydrogenase complex